jgi:hypothetical protein
MNIITVASFAAAILEARFFKLGNEFSNSQRQWRLLGCLLNSLARSGAGRDDEKIRLRPKSLATGPVSSNAVVQRPHAAACNVVHVHNEMAHVHHVRVWV